MSDDEVSDRYVLGPVLGRGGMAEVYQGHDRRLNRPVAIKKLGTHLAADPDAQLRFSREAHAAASLNHPAIAAVFDSGNAVDPETGTTVPYIVMELVDGSTLRELLNQNGLLAPDRALAIIDAVLAALDHSHAAGVIHRDIKPGNVMITKTGAVKVMDFGIARVVGDTSSSLTRTATIVGTAQYLSPEQASGEAIDQRSDLYSVGCLLYELLVGRAPFVGDSPISIAYQHVREDPAPPSTLNPTISPALDAFVLKALAKDPADRFPSAAAMQSELAGLLDEPRRSTAPIVAATVVAATVPQAAIDDFAETGEAAPPVGLADSVSPAVVRGNPPLTPTDQLVEPDRPQRGRAARVALIVAALGVLIAVGVAAWAPWRGADSPSGSVTVPNLLGLSRLDAETTLQSADLVPKFTKLRDERGSTLDQVVGQNPVSGRSVDRGSTVIVEINVGPKTAKVPDGLVGRPIDTVRNALEEAGFTDVRAKPVTDRTGNGAPGEVLSVNPDEGVSTELDKRITVRYVRGPATTKPADNATSTRPPTEDQSPQPPKTSKPRRSPTTEPTTSEPKTNKPTTKSSETAPPTQTSEPTKTSEPTPTGEPTKVSKSPKPVKSPKP